MLREWKRIFSIPNFYVVLLVIPPILFIFYGLIYQNQFARKLPIAIWDEDGSTLSHTLIDMMEQDENLHFTDRVNSRLAIEILMKQGKIFGAVYIPKNLEADVKKNHQSSITVFSNGAYLVPGKLIYKGAAGIIIKAGLAAVLQKSIKEGMDQLTASALIQPIKLNSTIMYNPDFNYQLYLTPGLITVGLQMALIVASVLILNIEFGRNTIGSILKISSSASHIIIAKLLAHLCVSWLIFVLVCFVVFPMFNLYKPEVNFNFFIIYTFMATACISLGMMISAISNNLLFVTDVALFYTSPAFVFSGFTFPRWAMPWYDQLYANIMPYTHFLDGYIKVYFMKLPLRYATPELVTLTLFIVISIPVAIVFFQQKINRHLKNDVL